MGDSNVDAGYNSVMAKRNAKANSLLKRGGYKNGGGVDDKVKKGVHQHEKHLHKGQEETKIKLKTGGAAEGCGSKGHMGKYARGGAANAYASGGAAKKSKKGGTTVNVVIAGSGQQQPQKVPVPVPAGGGGPPMPPRPPMAGGPPGAMPPGAMPPRPPMNRGGAIRKIDKVNMKAGAGGGLGRIEKIKDYGPPKRA